MLILSANPTANPLAERARVCSACLPPGHPFCTIPVLCFVLRRTRRGLVRERGSTPFGPCARLLPRSCFGRLFSQMSLWGSDLPRTVCGREGCVQPAFVNTRAWLQGTRVGPHPFVCVSHTALDLACLGNPI